MLLEHLASGGMAEVHRAVAMGTAGFSRPVAIKRIAPHLLADPEAVRLLIHEAKLAVTFNHPNVIRVSDLGLENGRYFLAMDYVAGQPLSRVMAHARERDVRLPVPFVLHVVRAALRGLAYVHQKTDYDGAPLGLIHRDVSPQNIMVGYEGAVLLVDFGIARATQRAVLTGDGVLRGKPGYLSPEVVLGGALTQSADLYAMGVVLHELLTLQPMRSTESHLQTLAEVMTGEFPRLETRGVTVPDDVAEVVHRALAPTPEGRFPDAEAMGAALDQVMAAHGWQLDAPGVGAQMQELFADDIQREADLQARFHRLIQESVDGTVTDAAARVATPLPLDDAFRTTPALQPPAAVLAARARHGSRTPLRTAFAALAVVAGGGLVSTGLLVGDELVADSRVAAAPPAACVDGPPDDTAVCLWPMSLVEGAAAGRSARTTNRTPVGHAAAARAPTRPPPPARAERRVLEIPDDPPPSEQKPPPSRRADGLALFRNVAEGARRMVSALLDGGSRYQ
ncbi:MAG: serine/threonine-protein kinase [Myxococcota bacterium]